jgi:hypothetical protein
MAMVNSRTDLVDHGSFASRPLANVLATLGSWRNQVEHCFGMITDKRIRRSVFRCVDEFQARDQRIIRTSQRQSKTFRLDRIRR